MKINRNALREAIELAALTTTKDSGSISSVILFDFRPDVSRLYLKSTNHRAYSRASLTFPTTEDVPSWKFTVEAKALVQWVSNVGGDMIDIQEPSLDGVTFICDRAKIHLRSLDPSTFTDLEAEAEKATVLFTGSSEDISDALTFVKPFLAQAGSEDAKLKEGLQVARWDGNRLFGTDGKMMAVVLSNLSAQLKIASAEMASSVSFLKKNLSKKVKISRINSLVFFEADDGNMYAYSEPTYKLPSLSAELPVDPNLDPIVFVASPAEIQRAIRAVSASADPSDYFLTLRIQPKSRGLDSLVASLVGGDGSEEEVPAQEAATPNSTHELVLAMKDISGKYDNEMPISIRPEKGIEEDVLEMHLNYDLFTKLLNQFNPDGAVFSTKIDNKSYLKAYDKMASGSERCVFLSFMKPKNN